jgi:uncharacterized membrane protein
MGDLIVVTLDREEDAAAVLRALRSIEKSGNLQLEDTALVSKDADGKVHLKNEMGSGTEIGIAAGAVIGGLVTVFFPVVGIVGGGVVGGLIGRSASPGVDGKFVKEVAEELEPGKSAIFALIRSGSAAAVAAAFRGVPGKLRQTSLSPEFEEELRAEMSGRG